jgi:DNA polymerase-3 subunit beta
MLINLRALKAVAHFASTEETRYYLNGVCLEVADDHLIMVATDGHVLGAVRQSTDVAGFAHSGVIVPLELIDQIKLKRGDDDGELHVSDDRIVTITYRGTRMAMGAIDGSFPGWRAVVPRGEPTGGAAHFQPHILARVGKAMTLWSGEKEPKPIIAFNGLDPAVMDWFKPQNACEGFGVIMPYRVSAERKISAPHWSAWPVKAESAKAA